VWAVCRSHSQTVAPFVWSVRIVLCSEQPFVLEEVLISQSEKLAHSVCFQSQHNLKKASRSTSSSISPSYLYDSYQTYNRKPIGSLLAMHGTMKLRSILIPQNEGGNTLCDRAYIFFIQSYPVSSSSERLADTTYRVSTNLPALFLPLVAGVLPTMVSPGTMLTGCRRR
jgi:hypothetical protein